MGCQGVIILTCMTNLHTVALTTAGIWTSTAQTTWLVAASCTTAQRVLACVVLCCAACMLCVCVCVCVCRTRCSLQVSVVAATPSVISPVCVSR
jgi:hypothetical protein